MQAADGRRTVCVLLSSGDRRLVEELRCTLSAVGYVPCVMPSRQQMVTPLSSVIAAAIIDVCNDDNPFPSSLLKHLSHTCRIPCLALTAARRPDQRVRALQEGASDVISRPVYTSEVVARLRAILKGQPAGAGRCCALVVESTFVFDPHQRAIIHGRGLTTLTSKRCALLACLIGQESKMAGFDDLSLALGLSDHGEHRSVLRQAVSRLRGKLAASGHAVDIVAVRGFGYRLKTAEDPFQLGLEDKRHSTR